MVPILSIGKVVVREIGTGQELTALVKRAETLDEISRERNEFSHGLPRQDNIIVNPIQLHMLQTPSLIDTLRQDPFPKASQIWRVPHTHFYACFTKLLYERHEQRCT